ncbi:hypothetical protein N2152v2_002201 [Parachlorella kessleri]
MWGRFPVPQVPPPFQQQQQQQRSRWEYGRRQPCSPTVAVAAHEGLMAEMARLVGLPPHATSQAGPNPNAMRIIVVGAECAPWSKTGGLGDVMAALPKALAARGHQVMIVAPRYQQYDDTWDSGVRLRMRCFNSLQEVSFFHTMRDGVDCVFIDHPAFHNLGRHIYGGSHMEVLFRSALLSKAALEAPWHVPCCAGGATYGSDNLLFVANDWHAALLPVYLQAHYRDYGKLQYARSLLVLHNVAHQGRFPLTDLHLLEIPEHYQEVLRHQDSEAGHEHLNILKAGAITCHRLVAVSRGYAKECQTKQQGFGLEGVLRQQAWKLRGVVNGIDYSEWHPLSDPHLQSDGYTNYDADSLALGKACCKAALQQELGLPVDSAVPLLAFIGRLDQQKGVDLIRDSFEWLMGQGAQLVLLGSGQAELEAALRGMEQRAPSQCRAWVGFSVGLAHRITAGADMLLMPSRFEPCGLNQLYAMAYGTVPIVRSTGGLADTVFPFDPYSNQGTGWVFEKDDALDFRQAMQHGLFTFREHRQSFEGLQLRGMAQDLSWGTAAAAYEEVLLAAR